MKEDGAAAAGDEGNGSSSGEATARSGRWLVGAERERDSGRVEAFSDAVIAIVLTLMSVELFGLIPADPSAESLGAALVHEWPAFLAYTISFLIVGQIWVTHHNMWRYVERVDQTLVALNLALLFFVAPIPWTASLLAEYLRGSYDEQVLTAGIYVGVILGEAVFFNLSWWWAARRGLLDARMHPDLVRAVSRRYRIGPLLYLLAFAAVFVNAVLSLALYVLLIGLYIFPGAGDLPSAGRKARV
ncbi:TMEM175 family protein [Streptomyces sp. NPDC052015]|uniref:TMEM175 family protein n=1 Tax=Streptomyces sp. NPDC052015 TaxID=3154755 RepID=UPI00343276E3